MRQQSTSKTLRPARSLLIAVAVMVLLLALAGTSLAAPIRPHSVADVTLFDLKLGPYAPMGKSNLGNYVWIDANADGNHTGAEAEFGAAGVDGVKVNLYLDANFNGVIDPGEYVGSTLTGDDPGTVGTTEHGWYNFAVTADGTQYIVEIDPSNFASGGPLAGLVLTSKNTYGGGTDPLVAYLGPLITTYDTADFGYARPSIQVVKTAGSALDGTTLYLNTPGGGVLYTYVVTNNGQIRLTNIVVKDDNGTPGNPADDIAVCTIAGPLAPGASSTCTTTLNISADHTNVATATGQPVDQVGQPTGGPVSDTDDAVVDVVAPAIEVVKTAGNAADGAVYYLSGGGSVTYTYVVTNKGDTHLTDIAVKDDNGTPGNPADDIAVCTIAGPLAPNASSTCTTTLNISADHTNVATATGTPSTSGGAPLGVPNVSDTDDAVVDVVAPAIEVVKRAGAAADGATLYLNTPGGSVTYTYVVTNKGDTYLTNIVVKDDNGTPGNTADDIAVCTIAGPLAPNASSTCTTTLNISADHTNVATATGTPSTSGGAPLGVPNVSDTDDAVVDVVAPAIEVVKRAGAAADGATLYLNTPGGSVTYTYVVTNKGDTYLTNIVVKDDNGTPGNTADDIAVCTIAGPLAPNASSTCTTTLNISADHTNVATATGTPSTSGGAPLGVPNVSDTDDAVVDVVAPAIEVVKTAGNAADGAVYYLPGGGSVTYTYVVTNKGDTHLTNIVVKDDNGTPGNTSDDFTVCTIAGPLAPNASSPCTTALNITANTTNIATATGTPSTSGGAPMGVPNVSDTDDAVVNVVKATIEVIKKANNAADGSTIYVQPGANVTYTYAWKNTGNTYLKDITVYDDNGTPADPTDDFLVCAISGPVPPNYSFTCSKTVPISVNTTNTATVSAKPVDGSGNPLPGVPDATDTDDAIVLVYSAIGDYVWWDLNNNGQQDAGEPPIKDVTVELYKGATLIGTSTTDANGKYSFGTLEAGTYTVKIQAGEFASGGTLYQWTASPQNVGPDATDSDGHPTTHDTTVVLPAGVNDMTIDFGFVAPPTTWSVTKTLDPSTPSPVRVGKEVKFKITIVNNGPGWLSSVPLQDVYDTAYLTYGYGGSFSTPASIDNVDDGQINWSDLAVSFGTGLAPGQSWTVVVRFTAKADTTALPSNGMTENLAIISGAKVDPDGPTGPLPPTGPTDPRQDPEPVELVQPTGVALPGSSVTASAGGVLVAWDTASELQIAGFSVLRGETRLADFIVAKAAGANAGAFYSFLDENPGAGSYVLEIYKTDGSVERVDLGS